MLIVNMVRWFRLRTFRQALSIALVWPVGWLVVVLVMILWAMWPTLSDGFAAVWIRPLPGTEWNATLFLLGPPLLFLGTWRIMRVTG